MSEPRHDDVSLMTVGFVAAFGELVKALEPIGLSKTSLISRLAEKRDFFERGPEGRRAAAWPIDAIILHLQKR